jgi:glycosyltransferase involved in cell wall biosynthesis
MISAISHARRLHHRRRGRDVLWVVHARQRVGQGVNGLDEPQFGGSRVFLGGINLYLDSFSPWARRIPRFLRRWLDSPTVLGWATGRGVSNDARELGEMSLATLAGADGPQKTLVEELARFVGRELRPDVVCFSNALLAGTLSAIRREYDGPIACVLQGDDIFLDGLVEPYRSRVLARLRERAAGFDALLTHSHFYRDHMAALLDLPVERFRVTPLGIDLTGHDGEPRERLGNPPTVGFFARICPEKGLHLLVDAMKIVRRTRPDVRLAAGGYLGPRDADYFASVKSAAAGFGNDFVHVGSPDGLADKVAFLKTLDLFSVPATYREPKGLSILEALANGVPVIQPDHGAYPEILARTGGGVLFRAGDTAALAERILELLSDDRKRCDLARQGRDGIHRVAGIEPTARETLAVLESLRR